MPNHALAGLLQHLRNTHFQDLGGTRVSAAVPISERLINEAVAAQIKPGLPVRQVAVTPLAGDAFSVRILPRAALLPSLTVRVEIIAQPQMPASPVLVLRMATMSGLFAFAGGAFSLERLLPPGVRLDGDRILVDLAALARQNGAADLLEHLASIKVNTQPGKVVVTAEVAVAAR